MATRLRLIYSLDRRPYLCFAEIGGSGFLCKCFKLLTSTQHALLDKNSRIETELWPCLADQFVSYSDVTANLFSREKGRKAGPVPVVAATWKEEAMSEPNDFRLLFPDDTVLSLELLQQHGGLLEIEENMHVLRRNKP